MSQGTHPTPSGPATSSRLAVIRSNKVVLIVAGLFVAVLSAGVLIQIFRAEPGVAGDNGAGLNPNRPGTAKVTGPQQMAKVGGQFITRDMLAEECLQRYGQEVLDNMINRIIIQQACLKKGIVISQTEVEQEIQKIAQQFKLDTTTWYQMLLTERNLSPIQYQRDIIFPMLALRKIAGEEIVITNKDRREAFERDYGPQVKAKMIMLDNIRRAEKVWHKATQLKEDFGRLARENSIEPTSRALGGDIPNIRKHVGSKEVWMQAFKLRPGEISGIIQAGPERYVILLCEGFTEPVVTNYNEVRDIIEKHLIEEKRQEAVAKVFEQLKKEIRVDNFLTNMASGGIRQTSGTSTPPVPKGGRVVPAGRTPANGARRTSTTRNPARR